MQERKKSQELDAPKMSRVTSWWPQAQEGAMALINRGRNSTMGWDILLILCMQGTPALFSPHAILEQPGKGDFWSHPVLIQMLPEAAFTKQ